MSTYQDLQEINNRNFQDTPSASKQIQESISIPDPIKMNLHSSSKPLPVINTKGIDERDSGKSSLFKSMAGDVVYQDKNTSVASPFASDYFNTKMFGFDLGEVTDIHKDKFNGINPYSKAADFENIRRNAQSNFSTGINMLNQFVAKTAINTIGGVIGGFYGIGSAIANQDSSKLFDNSVNRNLDTATDMVESGNSLFTSQKAKSEAPLGFFSFETLKDISDAFSFTTGAVLSALATDGITEVSGLANIPGRIASKVGLLGKTTGRLEEAVGLGNGVRKAGNYITRSEELSNLLMSSDPNDINKLQGIARNLGSTVEDLAKYRKNLDLFNNTIKSGRNIITGTFWEAGLEARHTKDEFTTNEQNKLEAFLSDKTDWSEDKKNSYRDKENKRITDTANVAGLWTFGLNTAVLGASNYVQFPTIFGMKPTVGINGLEGKLTKQGLNNYIKAGGKTSDVLRLVGSALKSPFSEFMEETLQNAINTGSKSYYESMMGTRTSNGELTPALANLGDSVSEGLKQAYGTKAGLYDGLIGALVGAIGSPGIARNSKGKIRPNWMSETAEAYHEYKENNHSIKEAANLLNQDKFDTLLSYNKDNAILASIDSKKETVANLNEDSYEIDRLRDNKIFRHVKDRLDKGLESYMKQDVKDLVDMPFDEYKEKFQKGDNFTEQQKHQEVLDFASKVDIYSDAYKKIYEGLQLDRINNNKVSKKYFDTLVYAVANEKIYKQKQKELTDKLLSNPNVEMNYNELVHHALLSDKFKAHNDAIDNLIKIKKLEKEAIFDKTRKAPIEEKINNIKPKIEKEYYSHLDEVLNNNSDTIDYLQSLIKLKDSFQTETYKNAAANSEEIFANVNELSSLIHDANEAEKLRRKETTVNTGQFGPIRSLKETTNSVLDSIKKDFEKTSSKSLEILRGNKNTPTQKELEDYIDLKDKAQESIRKSNNQNQNSFLDNVIDNHKDIQATMNELSNITSHQVLALDIANNLYGFNKTDNAYAKIANASFTENINNLNNDIYTALELLTKDDEDFMSELATNLDKSIENIKQDLDEFGDLLTEEAKEEINSTIERAKDIKNALIKELDIQDRKEDIAEDTLKEDLKSEQDNTIKNIESIVKEKEKQDDIVDKESKGEVNTEEFSNDNITLFNDKNLHTITITNTTQPELIELKRKIDSGEIKYNSATVINYNENHENNSGFKNYLKNLNITDNYNSGKNKVTNNSELLKKDFEDLDPDVKIFITHSPVDFNIYNKQVDLSEGNQDFSIDEDDTPEHNFLYFSPQLEGINNSAIEKYNLLKKEIEDNNKSKQENIKTQLKNNSISQEDYNKQRDILINQYNIQLADLNAKSTLETNNINDKVLFSFRQQLLANKYNNGLNELKMRLGNINNGYLEKVGDTTYDVEEFGITSDNNNENYLIENTSKISADDLLFGNQAGEFINFNNKKVKVNKGSIVDKTTAGTGKIYLMYKTLNNQNIPVLLNRSKIGSNEKVFNEILYQLEEYFKNNMKQDSLISLKDNSLTFLKNKTYKEFFESFFNKKNGISESKLDTLNIAKNSGIIYLGNLALEINNIDTFNKNKEKITNAIADMRFFLNKISLRNEDGSFNNNFLSFILTEKLINHSFNTKSNTDKIFTSGFNKSIQFHILNTQANSINKIKTNSKEDTGSIDDEINALLDKVNKKVEITNTSEPILNKAFIEQEIDKSMAELLAPGEYDPDYISDSNEFSDDDITDFTYDPDTESIEENIVSNNIIEILSKDNIDNIEINNLTLKRKFERLNNKLKEKTLSKKDIQNSFNDINANTYEKLIEAINILYSKEKDNLNKFVTFANELYNREDKNENCK